MPEPQPPVSLDSTLDLRGIASVYSARGRVHVPGILSRASAQAAHQCLMNEVPWQLHCNDGERSFDLGRDQVSSLPEATQVLLHDRLVSNAANGFQFLFDNFPLSDAHAQGRGEALYVMRVFEFLNSTPFLDFARQVTGATDISFADAQATLY
ncbi:MAG TPA: hypothetical protein VIT67_01325, partial [Povalibacter sp.]